jgi:hypothetical protein
MKVQSSDFEKNHAKKCFIRDPARPEIIDQKRVSFCFVVVVAAAAVQK